MKDNYTKENDILMNDFHKRLFFDKRFTTENFESIELIWGRECNLKCKYCYYKNYGDSLYPKEIDSGENRKLDNLKMIVNWMKENRFEGAIEIFSGEPFIHEKLIEGLHYMLDSYKDSSSYRIKQISVPTNGTFILNKKLTVKVKELLDKSYDIGIPIFLSFSIDGKYCESNRPMKSKNDKRDDKFYDDIFKFSQEYPHSGFHPMVYSESIENWKKNFLWFQKMFKKYNRPWHQLYLLEIRNWEWTLEQIREYGKFIEFMLEWTFDFVKGDKNKFLDCLYVNQQGFNILSNPFTTIGRGIGCSIQSTFTIRVGDLAIVPCHRLAYDKFISGYFNVEDGKITDIRAKDIELLIAIKTIEGKNFPYCENCAIKDLCMYGCLGSQYEVTGDMFTPIPSVCLLFHKKLSVMYKTFKRLDVWDMLKVKLGNEKRAALEILEDLHEEGNREV